MSKAEMVRRLADETDLTQAQATEVVETIFNEIKRALEQGDAVILRGFGSFHVRDKHARIGRNPKTGQEAAIPPRRVVRFKSGKFLKHAVNRSFSEPLASQS
jgi:integration host factor alpha subunit